MPAATPPAAPPPCIFDIDLPLCSLITLEKFNRLFSKILISSSEAPF